MENQLRIIKLEERTPKKEIRQSEVLGQIKYISQKLVECLNKALDVTPTNLSVLIQGEIGVGKEAFAKLIHEQSLRSKKELIIIGCVTLEKT